MLALLVLTLACSNLQFSIGRVGAQEINVVVMTADQLKREVKAQVMVALDDSLPAICSCRKDNGSYSSGPLSIDHYHINALEELQQTVTTINNTVNEILSPLLDRVSHLFFPGKTPSHPATSCMEIKELMPSSPSGYYWIKASDDSTSHMYCDMERSCKGVGGGWMRVASINMSNSSHVCPQGLRTLNEPMRLCAMNTDSPGCSSAVFPLQGVKYSRVCGKTIGYQQKSPDAFFPYNIGGQRTIDSRYVDGISITHGYGPRKHIWTFAAALHEYNTHSRYVCPCTNTRNSQLAQVPPFVGHDYFCDTASENHFQYIFYRDDPLWDGEGCGTYSTCCSLNSPPWFMKQLSTPTTDDIEIRLCCDENRSNEDITMQIFELYVQ